MKTESQEQIDFIQWCKRNHIHKIFAIPNGGKRHIATASRLKLEGVKPGVPDLMIPVARFSYHGLFIEMKREKGGVLSRDQELWRDTLQEEGYAWRLAKGAEHAKYIIKKYLSL